MIDPSTVKRLFFYDAESGMLFWRAGNGRNVKPWQQVKSTNGRGYICAKVGGKSYLAHRLAWLYVHSEFSAGDIDHKNRVRNDNRLCNLRDVSRADNCQNISAPSHNKSGHIGVSWIKSHNAWTVYIKVRKKNKWLGYFKDLDKAIAARKDGEAKYYNLPEAS